MNPEEANRGDDLFSSLLAAYDEALAQGNNAEPPAPPPPELEPRLQRARELLDRLEREWPRAAPVEALSAPPPAAPPGGAQLGRFHIRKELGRGGCGVVFLAFDPVLRREVALKVPRPEVLVSPALRSRFLREAQAAAGLDHPYLVSVYEAEEIGPVCYIASAYCDGPTLANWLKSHAGPVPADKAAMLIAALAEGIAHAHDRGILHRDLKPSNVLLSPKSAGRSPKSEIRNSKSENADPKSHPKASEEGAQAGANDLEAQPGDAGSDFGFQVSDSSQGRPASADAGSENSDFSNSDFPDSGLPFVPRVTDFGLAKVMETDRVGSAPGCETRSGAIIGTPQYMPPEQAEGRLEEFGPQVDVYSLGAILYELLTSQVPFPGKTDVEILRRIVSDEVVPPRRLRRDTPRDLETICLKCLEKDPKKRYQTAGALRRDLGRFLEKRPIEARRTPAWERALKWARRRPATAITGAIGGLALLGLVIGYPLHLIVRELDQRNIQSLRERATLQVQELIRLHDRETLVRRQQYDMELLRVQKDWADHYGPHMLRTLNTYRPRVAREEMRGFAWYYWWRQCQSEYFWLIGHTGKINGVAIDPRGTLIATASNDHSVKLWDAITGQLLATLAHPATVACLAFSHDGATLASGCEDHLVRLWDVAGRSQRFVLEGHEGAVRSVAFAPEGSLLASAGADGTVRLWDTDSARLQAMGKYATGLGALAFARDGMTLAAGAEDHAVLLWDVKPLRMRSTLHGHLGPVVGLAFSPDSKLLASVGGGSARLWDAEAAQARGEMPWSAEPRSIDFAPDGNTLLVAGYPVNDRVRTGVAKLFHVADRQVVASFQWDKGALHSAAFTPDGRGIALGGETGVVNLWRPTPPAEPVFARHHADVRSLAFDPAGPLLATAGSDKVIKFWNLADGQLQMSLRGHEALVSCITFAPDGKLLASGSFDNTVRLWDVSTGQEVAKLEGHGLDQPDRRGIHCLAISPNNQVLATAGKDFVLMLWNLNTRKVQAALRGHRAPVRAVAFSPDNTKVASASQDGTVRVWAVQPARPIQMLPVEAGEVWSVAFSHDGKTLAAGTSDGTIQLWDAITMQRRAQAPGHIDRVRALAFSPDHLSMASGSDDHTVRVWDPMTSQEVLTLRCGSQRIAAVAFSPDGRSLAAAGHDGSIQLWHGATDEEANPKK
jgi:WD40 repeat protein/serine/threonine protein kinase